MRKTLSVLALGIVWMLFGLLPSAKADTFVYNVSVSGFYTAVFELPTFQEAVTTSTFLPGTSPIVAVLSLSGNSTGCSVNDQTIDFGPCVAASLSGFGVPVSTLDNVVPAFNGPGTFTRDDGLGDVVTITITDVPVPEPSSLLLLGCGLFSLPVLTSLSSRIRDLAR